jgi:hypothetical protein
MDFRALAKGGLAIELATDKRKSLAHSGQSKASAVAGSLFRGFHIKPYAIVPHDEMKRTRSKVQLDIDRSRLRVPHRVGESLLRDTKAGSLDLRAEPLQARIGEKDGPKTGPLRLLIQVRA